MQSSWEQGSPLFSSQLYFRCHIGWMNECMNEEMILGQRMPGSVQTDWESSTDARARAGELAAWGVHTLQSELARRTGLSRPGADPTKWTGCCRLVSDEGMSAYKTFMSGASGAMDNASDYGSEDSRFDSWLARSTPHRFTSFLCRPLRNPMELENPLQGELCLEVSRARRPRFWPQPGSSFLCRANSASGHAVALAKARLRNVRGPRVTSSPTSPFLLKDGFEVTW